MLLFSKAKVGCEYVGVKGHVGTEAASPCVCWLSDEPGQTC